MTRTRPRSGLVGWLVALAVVAAGIAALADGVSGTRHHARKPLVSTTGRPAVSSTVPAAATVSKYLQPAEQAYNRARAWWNPKRGWYRQFLPGHGSGAATMWGIVHLFGATNAIAIASPTNANVAAARAFADGAEHYWNPDLKPVAAYGSSPDRIVAHRRTWYDDEAWWGVAFYDAFRATGDHRDLVSAARSLRFINSGWDPRAGGIYWDNRRTFKSSESLAGGTLTAAALYEQTHQPQYLALAKKYIDWADRTIRAPDDLYGSRSTPANPMPYVEGPMAEAMLRLCKATGDQSYCTEGEKLITATVNHFKTLTMGPQYDAIYIRSLLEVYRLDHNPRWYRVAAAVGDQAMKNAVGYHGLYLRTWSGKPISSIGAPPYKLQIHAATTSVLAWLAAAKAPPGG